ncbi:MAG: hypothetical protein K5872_03310 [Rhizobiaceae bacterium]|nr:hypothetical protein [Rhizobiaceae bacterium]MCV0405238.1 hypothetical protein [Rhizobiaceae bacterium]
MPRIIALCSALFWTASFAMQAIGQSWMAPLETVSLHVLGMTLANALAAAMFVWMAITILFESDPESSDGVVRSAFSVAGGITLLGLLRAGVTPEQGTSVMPAVTFAALMATYAAIHAEKRAVQDAADDGELDEVRRAARHMARTAARTILFGRMAASGLGRMERDDAA